MPSSRLSWLDPWTVAAFLMLAGFTFLWRAATVDKTDIPVVVIADSTADWLVTTAAAEGDDPYSDLRGLAELYGVDYQIARTDLLGPPPYVHPRTPGALLLQTPMLLSTPQTVHRVMTAITALCLFYLLQVSRSFAGVSARWVAASVPFVGLSGAVGIGVVFGAQST